MNSLSSAPWGAPVGTITYVYVEIGYALSSGGQSFGPRIGFAPLPKAVHSADEAALGTI